MEAGAACSVGRCRLVARLASATESAQKEILRSSMPAVPSKVSYAGGKRQCVSRDVTIEVDRGGDFIQATDQMCVKFLLPPRRLNLKRCGKQDGCAWLPLPLRDGERCSLP